MENVIAYCARNVKGGERDLCCHHKQVKIVRSIS